MHYFGRLHQQHPIDRNSFLTALNGLLYFTIFIASLRIGYYSVIITIFVVTLLIFTVHFFMHIFKEFHSTISIVFKTYSNDQSTDNSGIKVYIVMEKIYKFRGNNTL